MLRNGLVAARGFAALLTCVLAHASSVMAADLRLVTFGGATLTGNYYAIATAICARVNDLGREDLRCSPEATPGSLYNLQAMKRGELDFALVQSDWQRAAVYGIRGFEDDGPMTELRSVMSLYQEALTLIARRDADIASVNDLRGKVLDIGHPSTGRRATVQALVDALGLDDGSVELRELMGPAVADGLCGGRIDATMVVFGHPNPTVARFLEECDLVLVPVAGRRVDVFLNENDDYDGFAIPGGTYSGFPDPVETFSVGATLVVRDDIPDEIVSIFTSTLLENYEALSEELPVLPQGDPLGRRAIGLTAPVHPAAEKIFAGAGG
ncbi:TAXI family TRAP transporter solute-binding subunit [Halovulum sp. GXIMD14794]